VFVSFSWDLVDRMQKLSRLRTLKGFGSIVRSTSTGIKATNPKPSDVGGSLYGSFTNLKITAGL
jgi:hypothetical protein